jgi:hypothetical protein
MGSIASSRSPLKLLVFSVGCKIPCRLSTLGHAKLLSGNKNTIEDKPTKRNFFIDAKIIVIGVACKLPI